MGKKPESKRNGAQGRAEAGGVLVRFERPPPAGKRALPGALVVAVEVSGAVVRRWDRGPYVECPLSLAEALDGLLDAGVRAGGLEAFCGAPTGGSLAAAVLDALDPAATARRRNGSGS